MNAPDRPVPATAAGVSYQPGFGNEFETEALAGALPRDQNSPQRVAFGLYAEQISGTAFTAARHINRRTWTYRIRPAVLTGKFARCASSRLETAPLERGFATPNPLRWNPFELPAEPTDFVDGLATIGGNGDALALTGVGIHVYCANRSMVRRYFYCADGELLVVPQLGRLRIRTELGLLEVEPGELCTIPRGLRFAVDLLDEAARGYVCENYGASFRLPELGPLGANALAYPAHFLAPAAAFEDLEGDFRLVAKFGGSLWEAPIDHSPLDVVAWRGNYVPYKYDLRRFNVIGTVSFDHPDPSIFTVLTSPSDTPGVANCDFVIFPSRWMVARDTFRPPWYHRNVMSEFMGMVYGVYDAKPEGFLPGGASLHNCMSGHGPDTTSFETASAAELAPVYLEQTLAFMFETRLPIVTTRSALESPELQSDYAECWKGLSRRFPPQ